MNGNVIMNVIDNEMWFLFESKWYNYIYHDVLEKTSYFCGTLLIYSCLGMASIFAVYREALTVCTTVGKGLIFVYVDQYFC